MPRISVCMASYNGGKYIKEQLLSILKQIGKDDEVIVSDDGSSDDTLSVIGSLHDERIRLVKGPSMGSPTMNFEHALGLAKGEIIFLADQDDVWTEDKVTVCLKYLQTCDCVVSDAIVTDGALQTTCDSFFRLNHTKRGLLRNLFGKNGYLGCCMAFKRCVLDKALPFPPKTPMHDIWIGNVAAFYLKLSFIPEKLIRFRRHDHNSSSTARESIYGVREKLMFRWRICRGLIKILGKH